jgi:hypothetical protein
VRKRERNGASGLRQIPYMMVMCGSNGCLSLATLWRVGCVCRSLVEDRLMPMQPLDLLVAETNWLVQRFEISISVGDISRHHIFSRYVRLLVRRGPRVPESETRGFPDACTVPYVTPNLELYISNMFCLTTLTQECLGDSI